MKSDVLKEVIKKIVQQEVKSILKKELRSCLAEIILSEDSRKSKVKETSTIKMEEILEESVEDPVLNSFIAQYGLNTVLNEPEKLEEFRNNFEQ